jgi:hypothetical protein
MVTYTLAGLKLDRVVCSRSFPNKLRPCVTIPRQRAIVPQIIGRPGKQPVAARCDVGQKKRAIASDCGFSKSEHTVSL